MMDFPNAPTVGQVFGNYTWDGEKWGQTAPIGPAGIPEAPLDGATYGRHNADWTPVAAVTPAALTKTNDTNVILTLGGTPATALLQATTITAGWAGTLSGARGGFGADMSGGVGVPLFTGGVAALVSATGSGSFVRSIDPVLAGTPTAPTAAPVTNTTQVATTAFVTAAVAAGSTSLIAPVGTRLSYLSGSSAMVATVAGIGSIYCVPHLTSLVPVWNGAQWSILNIGSGIGQTLSDITKSPAAVVANKVYDLFVWDDAGTPRLSRGPVWTSATTRALTLTRRDGVWTNTVAIANGPLAARGTWMGTFLSGTSALGDWRLGAVTPGGSQIQLTLWNAYNRLAVAAMSGDSTSSWNYGSSVWEMANQSANNSAKVVVGAPDDCIQVIYAATMSSDRISQPIVGIGVDTVTANSGSVGAGVEVDTTPDIVTNRIYYSGAQSNYVGHLAAGSHTINAIEASSQSLLLVFYGGRILVRGMF